MRTESTEIVIPGIGTATAHGPAGWTVVLCGPMCAGKTTLGRTLADTTGASLVTARGAIERIGGRGALDRAELVRLGAKLEAERPGAWLAEAVAADAPHGTRVIVDAARTAAQIEALAARPGPHLTIYLEAASGLRAQRFRKRTAGQSGECRFEDVDATPVEQEVKSLAPRCDVVLDTALLEPDAVAAAALRRVEQLTA
jgi:cytidylate kinase